MERLGLLKYLKWGRRMILLKKQEDVETLTTARRIRLALQDLGATFVKFGQILSTRPDLIPADVIEELALLQENVPCFSTEEVLLVIKNNLGKPVNELYAKFNETPLAAGSLGQVHLAEDQFGRKLAVKVRRPRVIQEVERDLSLMLEIASLMEKHIPESQVFDPVGLVNHFSRTVRKEMNYNREARTMLEFARLFADDPRLHVPYVDEERSTDSVLTMEYIEGVRIDNRNDLKKCGIYPRKIAEQGAEIFLKQAFEFGIFHGDPHPGNLRVEKNGSIALLDYGMVGFLTEERREQLVDLLVSVARHDVETAVATITKQFK